MKSYFCSKQKEVAAALGSGRWPEACDAALHAHVATCRNCSDLILVAQNLQQARRETMQELRLEPEAASATLASSGTLWWRSELRRRRGAVERMARPIAFVEKLALMSIPLALLALIAWQWNQITGWLSWLVDLPNVNGSPLDDLGAATVSTPSWMPILLMASIGGFILVWGFALFLLARRD